MGREDLDARLTLFQENYGRTKETHAHTKALWEKEIRRARKETFKTQSTIVKLQEELKTARTAVRILEDGLENEKDRSHVREQEAFTSRYQLVGVQEQFEQALAQIKVVEQERDAFKTAAKNEEIARMAAEGRIPLPSNETPDDEFATPKVKKQKKTGGFKLKEARVSLSSMDIVSSEASELEIEALDLQVQWEKQRADRAQEMIEFLQAECQMHVCACSKFMARSSAQVSHQEQPETVETLEDEPAEDVTMVNNDEPDPEVPEVPVEEVVIIEEQAVELSVPKSKKEARRSTIFFPQEGIFRTISEQDAAAAQAQLESEIEADIKEEEEPEEPEEPEEHDEPDAPVPPSPIEAETNLRTYARTPSVDPPAFALLSQERTSLLSLLNAPQSAAHTAPLPSMASIPTIPDEEAPAAKKSQAADAEDAGLRTSSSAFTVTTTVPLRGETLQASASFSEKLRTPSSASSSTTFDSTNPALTPTMTREEALAKIRERRGRAKSAAQGATTARKKMAQGSDRRDLSAPTAKAGPVKKKS